MSSNQKGVRARYYTRATVTSASVVFREACQIIERKIDRYGHSHLGTTREIKHKEASHSTSSSAGSVTTTHNDGNKGGDTGGGGEEPERTEVTTTHRILLYPLFTTLSFPVIF